MSRLSHQQWSNIRSAWEASSQKGYAWLTVDSGGPWSVSREAVRLRASKEAWRKLPGVAGGTRQVDGHPAADAPIHREVDGALDGENPGQASLAGQVKSDHLAPVATKLNDDERLELRDKHQREWGGIARPLLYELAREARLATGSEKARIVKSFLDGLRMLQQAEAALHGLEVLDFDWDNLTLEELKLIYEKGRLPK
jgi:hypothetical protein